MDCNGADKGSRGVALVLHDSACTATEIVEVRCLEVGSASASDLSFAPADSGDRRALGDGSLGIVDFGVGESAFSSSG